MKRSANSVWNRVNLIVAAVAPVLTFFLGASVASHQAHHDREMLEVERAKAFASLIEHLLSKDCHRRAIALTMAASIHNTLAARVGALLANDPCIAVRDTAIDRLRYIARQGAAEARDIAGEALGRRSLAEQLSAPAVARDLQRAGNYRGMHTDTGDERALEIYSHILQSLKPDARSELDAEIVREGWTAGTKTFGTEAVRYLAAAFSKYSNPEIQN